MPYQLQLVQTSLLCRLAFPEVLMCDVQALMSQAACFGCLTQHQLQLVQTQLLCLIFENGGGGGGTCLTCGAADPVIAATCPCSLYYNTTTASFWYWDDGLAQWFMLIGP